MSKPTPPDDPDSDRPSPRLPSPDAYGQAALLLVESLLHALLETRQLTLKQGRGIVRAAMEVKVDVAAAIGESDARMLRSLALLAAIGRSLDSDTGDDVPGGSG